jgi:hypothetical protein
MSTEEAAVEPQEAKPQDGHNLTPDWVREDPEAAYNALKSTREEAAAHRVRAKEAAEALEAFKVQAERSKLDEVGRLKAELDDATKRYQALEESLTTERYKTQLAGRVASVDDALKLLDETFIRNGQVDVDAFLDAKPFLAAKPAASIKNMNSGAKPSNDMNALLRRAAGR